LFTFTGLFHHFSDQSILPGCGIPANEEERLAATLQLQLVGKDPHPALQRYVELVAAVLKVSLL